MLEISESSITFKLERLSLPKAAAIVALITFVLGFTDLVIGSEISFSIFYLIPVTIAVFLHGRNLGLAFSLVCSLVWIGADIAATPQRSPALILAWNTIVRLGYFTFHTILISRLLETIKYIKDISLHDPLTKAANWRYFEEYANRAIKTAVRERQKIALAYIDVDNFKDVNDSHGHGVGDEVLKCIAAAMQGEIRPSDMLARIGGDEFAIILTNIEIANVGEIIERIRRDVGVEMEARKLKVTLSIGAIVFSVLPSTIGPMLKSVDDLMYEVKKSGKDNVRLFERAS